MVAFAISESGVIAEKLKGEQITLGDVAHGCLCFCQGAGARLLRITAEFNQRAWKAANSLLIGPEKRIRLNRQP